MELLCCRFQEVAFVVPAHAPPEYAASGRATPILRKACDYCRSEYPQNDYTDHLTTAHSDRLFHCEECNNYVDRKDFLSHMTVHAMEYSSENVRKEIKRQMQMRAKREIKDENENTEVSNKEPVLQNDNMDVQATPQTTVRSFGREEEDQNDFSDHSDTENDFGPLPESVFEAIEDSQDSQTESVETSNTADEIARNSVSTNRSLKTGKGKIGRKTVRRCSVCGKEYTVSSSYFYHVKYSHKQTKEHACKTCGRKFATKGSLAQHSSIHTGESPFECDECGKKFRSNASLYIHKQTHNGRKNYSCTHCDASFRWKTHLARHMTRHSKEKRHVCAVCGRGFSVKCDLLRHARTHEAGKIDCEKCGATFAQMRYLKVHMEKKHPSAK